MERDTINKVALVGAGVIGSGWALRLLANGLTVVLTDPSSEARDQVLSAIANSWRILEDSGLPDAADPRNFKFVDSIEEAVSDADFVQENVPEREDLKCEVHHEIELALLISKPLKKATINECANAIYGVGLALDLKEKETIAILVRSRSHITNILPVLKSNEIPFNAVDIFELSGQPVIQDLLTLTCAFLFPGDRTAWLACLRAPWCGLTIESLSILCEENKEDTIWQCIGDNKLVSR